MSVHSVYFERGCRKGSRGPEEAFALNLGVLGELGMSDSVLGGSWESYVQLRDKLSFS